MKNFLNKLTNNSGVIAIEFSFIYIIFAAFVFILFEVCKFYFVIVAMDYSLSQAARSSAFTQYESSNIDHSNIYKDSFSQQNAFWVMFIDPDAIQVDISFCESVNDILKDKCSDSYSNSKKLALYSVSYRYRPLKLISNMTWSESLFTKLDQTLTRKIVYMLESSR